MMNVVVGLLVALIGFWVSDQIGGFADNDVPSDASEMRAYIESDEFTPFKFLIAMLVTFHPIWFYWVVALLFPIVRTQPMFFWGYLIGSVGVFIFSLLMGYKLLEDD